jgi:hypothetical protein
MLARRIGATQGCDPSADASADTRGGKSPRVQTPMHTVRRKAVNPRGLGTESPIWRLALCVVEWQAKSERGRPIKISLDIPEALV